MRKIILFGFLAITSLHCWSQVESSNWDLIDQRKIPEWFEDAKFGIFIHWGVYSVPSYRAVSDRKYASYAEWYYARVMFDTLSGGADFHNRNYGSNFDYHDFAPMFRAELFDPAAWARMFKDSGAKYVVLTSKHHDGYCLWPASHPLKKNWNSLAVGPKRDLVGDLTKAVRNEGLKMGLYYSSIEWESSPTSRRPNGWWLPDEVHKKYRIPEDQFVPMINQQLREIINLYEPSLLFADGGEWDGAAEYWGTKEFLRWLYEESPVRDEIVVNDRLSKESPGKHGDYYSSEYQDADGVGIDHPWEESRGMGGSYGFNRAENLEDYRSSAELVHELVDIVSRGGNLLLNVGPTADGRIPVFMQERLSDIGHWLDTNGESIFGTRPFESGKANTKEVRFTRTDEAIYAICLKWPGRYLVLDGFPANREASVSLLGSDNEVIVSKSGSRLLIETPDLNPATFLSGYAWVFKISFAK